MILLRFEEISLPSRNMDIVFINFAEVFYQIWVKVWASNMNQNGTFPSRIWLS